MEKITLEVANLVSFKEASRILKVSRQTIYNMIARGELHPIAIGSNRYFLKSELDNIKNNNTKSRIENKGG